MPGIAIQGGGATFDTIPPAREPPENGEVEIEITGPGEDSVEISETPGPGPQTYGPRNFGDRFKFNIQNGVLDASLRFNAARTRSRGADVEAYSERQGVEFQVTQTAGTGSPSSALFALQFQDADPNSTSAGSQVEGRVAYNRMAEQNLNLLATL